MATKSISKNVHISDKESVTSLVVALETATRNASKGIPIEVCYEDVQDEKIRNIFAKEIV